LIAPVANKATGNEVRKTRRQLKISTETHDKLWSRYLDATRAAQQETTALTSLIAQFEPVLGLFPFFFVIYLVAAELKVKELNKQSCDLETDARNARNERDMLQESLRTREAWFARNEIVKFAHNRRHATSLLNFARAMAGLPEWGWFHSRRMCEEITYDQTPALPQQIFELIESIARSMKPLKLRNLERRLRTELLTNASRIVKDYATNHWSYLQEAIQFCEGKEFKRSEVPFKVMDRFLYHLERSKTIAELELAKANQLV